MWVHHLGLYADERKDKMTVPEQVETTVDCGGDLLTATTTVQKQVQREHCPFIAVNPEIKRIKTATLKDSKAQTLVDEIYKLQLKDVWGIISAAPTKFTSLT